MPPRHAIPALAAVVAALLAVAGPASAGEVIVVDGDRSTRVDDPMVPSRAEASIGVVPGSRAARASASRGNARVRAAGARPARAIPAVVRVLARAQRGKRIDRRTYRSYRRIYARARSTVRRLRGARRAQLAYVLGSVERLALKRRLGVTRMPAAFLQLRRNTAYWPRMRYPAAGDQISFRGSEILFQYYAGSGLQIQPLSTFKKANNIHGACVRDEAECDPPALRRLLDEMTELAVRRSRRFIAWEYLFYFDGGQPPWISGMAEATAIQAYARAADLLAEPAYVETAKKALPAFQVKPPVGVRTRGFRGGVHYLQYSFAPGLFIYNAFLQSLIGLYDFHQLTGDARALRLYEKAEPEAQAEIPFSDLGDWSMYSYRGRVSDASYHELLREFLQSMCTRRLGERYCFYAEKYAGYQTDPPELTYLGPDVAASKAFTRIRFDLSKLSAVELRVLKNGRQTYTTLATFSRGRRSFLWKPATPGVYRIEIAAKELRTGLGKKGRVSAQVAVE